MDPDTLDGMIEYVERQRVALPEACTEHFEGWDCLVSHKGKTWWKVFVVLNEQFGFYAREGSLPIENKDFELLPESTYAVGGGLDDITIVEKVRENPRDVRAPSDPTEVAHIEVGELSLRTKVISGVLGAPEFWWAGPIFNRFAPGPTPSFPDELWILTLDGDPKALMEEFYPQTDDVYPPPVPDHAVWEEVGLWEREIE